MACYCWAAIACCCAIIGFAIIGLPNIYGCCIIIGGAPIVAPEVIVFEVVVVVLEECCCVVAIPPIGPTFAVF